MKVFILSILAALAVAPWVRADNNPPPSQPANAVSPPFAGAGLNEPFPDNYYGADHGGSTISLSYPFTSPLGQTDYSRGVITYAVAPFTPRRSEGVYGMDVWLEQQDASGNWSVAVMNGGVPDQGSTYQPVNTPNPGPSASYTFTWTFDATQLPPNTYYRAFVYVYLYNQGGASQGNFYVASSVGTVFTGPAENPPLIVSDPPSTPSSTPATTPDSPPVTADSPPQAPASDQTPAVVVVPSAPATVSNPPPTPASPAASTPVQTPPPAQAPAASSPPPPVPPPFDISRMRFNATGTDAHVVNQQSRIGGTLIGTDPSGLQASPWPTLGSVPPATVLPQNTALAPAPAAP